MSQEAIALPAPATQGNLPTTIPPDEDNQPPVLQDILAERTLAMLGGAPKAEVDRLETAEKEHLARTAAETPASAAPMASKNEPPTAEQTGDTDLPGPASPHVERLEQTVAEIERALDRSGRREGLWNAEIANLVTQHSRATAALETAKMEAQRAVEMAHHFEQEREGVLAETARQYPDLSNQDSALWKVAAQMAREAHDPRHPDHLAGQQLDAPRYFTEKAAALLGMRPRANTTVHSSVPWAATPHARQPLRPGPASGTKQTFPRSPGQSEQQRVAATQARTLAMIGGQSDVSDDDPASAVLVL